jgi:hypothetical protein
MASLLGCRTDGGTSHAVLVRPSATQDAPSGVLVDVGKGQGVIINESWTPSFQDIARFEQVFQQFLARHDKATLPKGPNYAGSDRDGAFFSRQYHAREFAGRRLLSVNFIVARCLLGRTWKSGVEMPVQDGGACQFAIEYDAESQDCFFFRLLHGGCESALVDARRLNSGCVTEP